MRSHHLLHAIALTSLATHAMAAEVDFAPRLVDVQRFMLGPHNPTWLFAGDVDGDGDTDLVSTATLNDRLAWHEYVGASGEFVTREITIDADGWCGDAEGLVDLPLEVHGGDLDGDGDLDVVVAGWRNHTVAWFENDGGAPPSFAAHVLTSNAVDVANVHVVDLDGDGDRDVLAGRWDESTSSLLWFENTGGSPPVLVERVIPTPASETRSLHAADVDGDGDVDVITSSAAPSASVTWLENDGGAPPSFSMNALPSSVSIPNIVRGGDVDGDGDTDVVMSGQDPAAPRVVWFENDGGAEPAFTEHTLSESYIAGQIDLGDLDGDGDTDLVVNSWLSSGAVGRWFEQQPGVPATFVERTVGFGGAGVVMVDLDRDGDQDIATTWPTADAVLWYEHLGTTCAGDADGSGSIDLADLLTILSSWGPCP